MHVGVSNWKIVNLYVTEFQQHVYLLISVVCHGEYFESDFAVTNVE